MRNNVEKAMSFQCVMRDYTLNKKDIYGFHPCQDFTGLSSAQLITLGGGGPLGHEPPYLFNLFIFISLILYLGCKHLRVLLSGLLEPCVEYQIFTQTTIYTEDLLHYYI